MRRRTFEEMITYFNQTVSEMDIDRKYKIKLLGMITAIYQKYDEDVQHWIPCSERLPKRGKDVLVTRDYDGREDNNKSCRYVEVASCYGEDDDITWCSFSDEYKMKPRNHHVIAWMPLPEPYREGES